MTLSFGRARWRRHVSRGWRPRCLTMLSTSSVNVIGFDPNRQSWPLDGCADIAAANVRKAFVEGPAARQHRPSSCLRKQILLQARKVVRS